MSEQTPVAVVRSVYRRLAEGDIPGFLTVLAPDVRWVEAAGFVYPGTSVGPQAVLDNVFAKLGSEWEDFAAVPEHIAGTGSRVAVLGWYSGRNRATGSEFRARFSHWYEVTAGRVVSFEQVVDSVPVQAAAGPGG